MDMNKKGAAMISFHWLLIIIAGGAIFILFSFFISTGQQASETSLSVDVLLHFDTIFSSLVTTEKTEATLPSRAQLKLDFTCDLTENTADSSFRLSGGVTKNLDDVVLFSKKTVSGKELFTVARNYAIPYSVTSLLYITDPGVLYVIDALDDIHRKDIISLLPDDATIIQLHTSEAQFLNQINLKSYRDVIVIGVTSAGDIFQSLIAYEQASVNKDSVYLYHIEVEKDTDNVFDKGNVTGYRTKGKAVIEDGYFEYNSDEVLAGIIQSESMPWFKCVNHKLSKKIKRVALVLAKRSELLSDEYASINTLCKTYYTAVNDMLNKTTTDASLAVEYKDSIKEYNEKLEYQSCPLIY